MAKTVSVAQLGRGGPSRAIRDAQEGPVLVSKENRPSAWIVSAQAAKLAGLALGDVIDLCGRLRVSILWEPRDGIEADVEAAAAMAEESSSDA